MNKLELCKRLRQEAGIAGTGPTTTINQIGEAGRLVSWIEQAYEDIQDSRENWAFLRNDFSFNCTIAQAAYPKSTVTDLANWANKSLRCYLNDFRDERWLTYIEWETFRDYRLRGATRFVAGRPIEFTIRPDKSLVFFPIPSAAYTITGEYYKKAHTMSLDTDEPIFDRSQLAIVFNALMRYASYVESPSLYAKAQLEYSKLINRISGDRGPKMSLGGPMA